MHTTANASFDYRRFYNRIARVYAWAAPLWWPYTARALDWIPRQGWALEIGPGPGYLLARLAQDMPTVGLDLSEAMLLEARRRVARTGGRAYLVQGDACALPFRPGTFHTVVLTFAFSAIPDGLGALREMARVLVPGGRVVLVDAGIPEDRNRMARFLAWLWEQFGDFMRDEAALMVQAGLEVIHREEFGPWRCMRLVVGRRPG